MGAVEQAFYFGCWGGAGHFLHDPLGRSKRLDEAGIPWGEGEIDGALCPGWKGPYRTDRQPEGSAKIHHRGGWTALAFWDRSIDERMGCNSVFFMPGEHGFAEAVAVAMRVFPQICGRFSFPVRLDAEDPGD